MVTVGLATGYTSQNIGNAFFQLGGEALLRESARHRDVDLRVVPVPDAPGNWTLRRKADGNPATHFNLLRQIEGLDVLVIQGPSLSWFVNEFWNDTLASLRERGTALALLGIAFYRFDDDERAAVGRFLSTNPVVAISTRDAESARLLRDLAPSGTPLHNGIDSGFWVPLAFQPPVLAGGPYLAVTFDRYCEPKMVPSSDPDRVVEMERGGPVLRICNSIARRGKAQAYAAAMIDLGARPEHLGEYTIVRPEHRSNPPMHWKAYLRPNGLMADEPWSYLTTYANAKLTISDRVHACVAALAYGNRAMLMNDSPRGGLIDRVAPLRDDGRPRTASGDLLGELRAAEERFVAEHVLGAA